MNSQTTPDPSPPWGMGPYSIKRHGTTLTTCDSEPVQTPGCIQAHGALLVLRLGELRILQASENSLQHLGVPASQLLGQAVGLVVGAQGEARLHEMLEREDLDRGASYAFTLPARAGAVPLDVCVHTSGGVAVLEFEATGRAGQHSEGNLFALVKSAGGRLQAATSVRGFCQHLTEEVRTITGLDRVMVYRFHADHHGEVIAESKLDALAPWLGLHYPADDIPQPAREIFKRIWRVGRERSHGDVPDTDLHRAADGHGGVATKGDEAWMTIARSFVEQFGWGALIGIASGFTMALLLQHAAARDTGGGILALLGLLVTSSELARHLCGGSGAAGMDRRASGRQSVMAWPRTWSPGTGRPDLAHVCSSACSRGGHETQGTALSWHQRRRSARDCL
jgi:hypothetical protein